jgi:PPK2 family polyphosphate:nucleotide phosphotransferase
MTGMSHHPSEKDSKHKDRQSISELLRVEHEFVLASVDCDSTPGFSGSRKAATKLLAKRAADLAQWQEKLFAESRAGSKRSVLLVVQGMDTSGKGGIMRHVVAAANPEGVKTTAFKTPTVQERRHDFLWRIRKALPGPGTIGVFDRSHYEDVLIVRVHNLVPEHEWSGRYAQINAFEQEVVDSGTEIVKVMLHISKDEQRARLLRRLERLDKHYKYNVGDISERLKWNDYMQAYQVALSECSTTDVPWHVVPANKKWYARYAVQRLLLDRFERMAPDWPDMGIDVETERARLATS